MRERISVLTAAAVLCFFGAIARADLAPLPQLKVLDDQRVISRDVTTLIEELHYSEPSIDNSLSSGIFDRYLDMLDGNRQYFLASDVASLGRYRYRFDDIAKSGDLEPSFDIFNQYLERRRQRIEYALSLLDTEPDFTVDEGLRVDRSELAWPRTQEELDELWRKIVKFDAVNEMLDGDKSWEDARETLRKRYERVYKNLTQLTSTDVFNTFMNAVTQAVDPHSTYFSPRQSEEYRINMSLSYHGIGAELKLDDDYVTVSGIIAGGPAEIDGELKQDDKITAIAEGEDGEFVDVVGWRLDDVVERIRGPAGTVIRLKLIPAGSPPGTPQEVIALTRDEIKLEDRAAQKQILTVPYDGKDYKIGVVEVSRFYQDFAARSDGAQDYTSTSHDVARLLGELDAEGIDGLIMDLRQNGGGHLSEAIELSGLFIDKGPVVQLKETRRSAQELDDPNPGVVYGGPMAVLVDRYSASASEIFAAAIQDYDRGVIVGQQTFGKGTVQNLFNLDEWSRGSNYGQLTLTIGKYYRVTGESTQHRGVLPDVVLPSRFDITQVGESTEDTALRWDSIMPTKFSPLPPLTSEIAYLNDLQANAAKSDPDLEYLEEDEKATEELRASQEIISLNLEARRRQLDELDEAALERDNARRAALGQDPLESLDDLPESDTVDAMLLRQAGRIVAEMAERESNRDGDNNRLLSNRADASPAASTEVLH